ncbi:hypothetical protein [Gryllotalpicola koreensis]|uniref:DUF2746 domain-containing protein n=1 Tax=Gryllotalpicola koreensis TaxID=993086 RepID=A0ABP8A3M9_9MICO
MIALSLDTWVCIAGFIAVGTGLYTASRSEFRALRTEIKADIDHLDKRFASESAALKAELKADIQRLDDRVYALAAGLKPDIERAADQRRGA